MNKVKKYIDKLYKKTCNYRDKKGYRENLGYDSYNKVSDYMSEFNLTYQQKRAAPILAFYSPTATTSDAALAGIFRDNVPPARTAGALLTNPDLITMSTNYTELGKSTSSVVMRCLTTSVLQLQVADNLGDEGLLSLHFTANSRLGV